MALYEDQNASGRAQDPEAGLKQTTENVIMRQVRVPRCPPVFSGSYTNQGSPAGTTTTLRDPPTTSRRPVVIISSSHQCQSFHKGSHKPLNRLSSACLSRRSVSARPVDLPVHRDQEEGGVWGLADLQGAHWRRSQDRPECLTHARRSRPLSARSLRDEALKAEISRIHKNQLLGAGGPQDARDAGPP